MGVEQAPVVPVVILAEASVPWLPPV